MLIIQDYTTGNTRGVFFDGDRVLVTGSFQDPRVLPFLKDMYAAMLQDDKCQPPCSPFRFKTVLGRKWGLVSSGAFAEVETMPLPDIMELLGGYVGRASDTHPNRPTRNFQLLPYELYVDDHVVILPHGHFTLDTDSWSS